MEIEIWSDVVCPWCFIGKRRLESALAEFPHAEDVTIRYRSFELDPEAPVGGNEPSVDALTRKYGPGAQQMMGQVSEVAAGEGLQFRLADTQHYRTVDAHRLLHLALDPEAGGSPRRQASLKESMLHAHFEQARNLSDPQVLTELAGGVGIAPDQIAQVLDSDRYTEAVTADIDRARAYGATGVPFFVLDSAFGISGAQPVEVFASALEQAWQASHPAVTLLGADSDAPRCGPDGCAI